MTEKYKDKYWHPLVILEEEVHREKMLLTCKKLNISAAKVFGKLVRDFVNKYCK